MSFLQDFKRGLLSPSMESAETQGVVAEEITQEDVHETREERRELEENLDLISELADDGIEINQSSKVINAVGQAIQAAETMPPQASDVFVGVANTIINDASKVLTTQIPQLVTNDDGSVSTESVTGWFVSAAKAFGSATSSFISRSALVFSRLNDSSKGLSNRGSRIRSKMASRKGNGGKEIKLSDSDVRLLVKGSSYSRDLVSDLAQFAETSIGVSVIVEEYNDRLEKLAKSKILENIASDKIGSDELHVEHLDLVRKMQQFLKDQPTVMLGNVIYGFTDRKFTPILAVGTVPAGMDVFEFVKHNDKPLSLSNDEITDILSGVDAVIVQQNKSLENIVKSTNSTFKAVRTIVDKLVSQGNNENTDEFSGSVNVIDLLRIENELVTEMGRVCDRLAEYQSDLVSRINSILILIEESVFQD